ncbi:hypothetical protein F4694_002998 [Bacillus niacini]|uniref:Uncharacterized protein n=1 Tax=Neobacillus niacini TaxID=86668 RepID=A0A852TFY5_9BACI|nr:hypothetical protein [Neobacillus niacini]NYE06218.1 hypothetical protein [Neobacillus niacini]
MSKIKIAKCRICNANDVEYITKPSFSCNECLPYWNRADSIWSNKRRADVFFIHRVHFARHIKELYDKDKTCKYSGFMLYKLNIDGTLPIEQWIYDLFKFSVERYDSDKPYVPGNTILCANVFNLMKNNTEKDNFIRLVINLLEHQYSVGDENTKYRIEAFSEKVIQLKEEKRGKLTEAEMEKLITDNLPDE